MATTNAPKTKSVQRPLDRQQPQQEIQPVDDLLNYFRTYARQKPETAALVCIGIGFVLGWKLKPW